MKTIIKENFPEVRKQIETMLKEYTMYPRILTQMTNIKTCSSMF